MVEYEDYEIRLRIDQREGDAERYTGLDRNHPLALFPKTHQGAESRMKTRRGKEIHSIDDAIDNGFFSL